MVPGFGVRATGFSVESFQNLEFMFLGFRHLNLRFTDGPQDPERSSSPGTTKLSFIRVVVKIMVPFWVPLKKYGTYYLGYQKKDPNFDNPKP